MKLIYCLMIFFCPLVNRGQTVKALKIGDKVPDITINNILNYKTTSAKLVDFKDKMIIVDFMNTYCLNCIEALLRFDMLLKQYRDKVAIFIAINESKERVTKFLKTNPVAKKISIPVIVGDTLLEKLFPHVSVSHEVWIYKGIVKAITGSEYVKEKNFFTILSGQTPLWKMKIDTIDYDYGSSIMVVNGTASNYLSNDNAIFQSVLTPRLNGVAPRYIRVTDRINKVIKVRAINYSITGLYLRALYHQSEFPFSRVLLPYDDADYFAYRDRRIYRNIWEENNTYCYEATFPITASPEAIRQKINIDLDTYLHVHGRVEKRKTACYVLMKDTCATVSKKYVPKDYASLSSGAAAEQLVFISPANLVDKLNNTFWGIPFFNGVSPQVKMAIKLDPKVLEDIQCLKDALKEQNLVLKPITRSVKMLVLSRVGNKD